MERAALTRVALLAGVTAIALSALPPRPAGAAVGTHCGRVGESPSRATLAELRVGLLCLVNEGRERHGVAPLLYNEELEEAATWHSIDMVEHGYFAHRGWQGSEPDARVRRTGYVGYHRVGENIAWGAGGGEASAQSIFRSWMHSPEHRGNILDPGFRDFGVGVCRGFPFGSSRAAATYTLDLGARR